MARTIEEWVRILDDDWVRWMGVGELIPYHNELHEQYGNEPNEAIIPGEQRLANVMRSYGLEHRHTDALAEAAGTVISSPSPFTVCEARAYMDRCITLMSSAIALVQSTDEDPNGKGPIYLQVKNGILGDSMAKTLLKMINRWMPPGVKLKAMPKAAPGEFAAIHPTHELKLMPEYMPRGVSLWAGMTLTIRESASRATTVFKCNSDPTIKVTVLKSEAAPFGAPEDGNTDWHYVLGEVLVPDVPDRTKCNPDGSSTGADADVVNAVEVDKACMWFGANSQSFELMHAAVGGTSLDATEIRVAKNWTQYGDTEIAGTAVSTGTWMLGAFVRGSVREMIESGELQSWSISASAMAAFEEAQVQG